MKYNHSQPGAIKGTTVAIILLCVGLVGIGALAVWSYLQYTDINNNLEEKVAVAVNEERNDIAEAAEERIIEERKNPLTQFVGPGDYGRVTFYYPKNWSVYEAKDATTGNIYEAFLNPVTVPQIRNNQRYALRVKILTEDYDKVLGSYKKLIDRGDLKASSVSSDDVDGQRLDGLFTKELRGSAVFFKIRDKTLIIQTDADTFKKDFDKLIKTIEFNK